MLAGLAGAAALFAGGKSKQKVKEIKTGIEAMEATQKSYKKVMAEMKKEKEAYKAPDVSGDEADKFIKDFLKKRKNK